MSEIILDIQQSNIVEAIQHGRNIAINAVFGSGKTTTILQSVKRVPNKHALLVTYNTHLKNEVHDKVLDQKLENIDVHTYHSLSMKYFGYGKNDEELQIHHLQPPKINIPPIDILFIDEKQDMTLILYTFIQKFLKCLPKLPQIVICGDHLQGVYQFKGADKRFLTLGSQIYSVTFDKFEMTTSYRLTHSMAWFINECIYQKTILNTVKDGPPVVFFNESPYKAIYGIMHRLKECVKNGIRADDIFILSPSLKGGPKTPLKKLENMLYNFGLPVYYSTNEDRELNDKVIQNKVVFSTFHQSKGRERKVVVVFGFDESYFEFYAKDENRTALSECPSTLIVALSRAKELLMVVKDIEKKPLSFMKKNILELKQSPYIELVGSISNYTVSKRSTMPIDSFRKISVTDLVKYIKPDIQSLIVQCKDQLFVKKTGVIDDVEIDPFVVSKKTQLCEDVSDLIGMLVPSVFEEIQTDTSTIKIKLMEHCDRINSRKISPDLQHDKDQFLAEKISQINFDSSSKIEDLLYMIKVYKAIEVGIYSPFQIDHDHWLSTEQLHRILKNMDYHIKNKQLYEYGFEDDQHPRCYRHPDFGKIYITGRMDCLDREYVWEFKCVKELSLEHFLQMVCYQWLWNLYFRDAYGERKFRLLNIRTGEMYEMHNDETLVKDVIDLLILNRYEKMCVISDDEFVNICLDVRDTYMKL